MKKKRPYYGVGILDADYPVAGKSGKCPYYYRWMNLLSRCYSPAYLKTHPSYVGCHICDEWLRFSNFKNWMQKQDWEGKQLDKDILGDGKLYSPDTCVFVSSALNKFMLSREAGRGSCLLGVSKESGSYVTYIRKNGKSVYLGFSHDELTAHKLWQKEKSEIATAIVLDNPSLPEALKGALLQRAEKLKEDMLWDRITLRF